MRQCGLLLIKGVGEKHDTMQISEAPVSYEDLQEHTADCWTAHGVIRCLIAVKETTGTDGICGMR